MKNDNEIVIEDALKTSAEIGEESRELMFGADGEAYPGDYEWSLWTD